MLNQFYNYLSDKLIESLKEQSLGGGERYYLQFDEKKQVQEFYSALYESEYAEDFTYQHERGTPYSTFALHIDGIRVVVAATRGDVTPDFLVTLRNKVGEQTGQWENTALLSICDETLDSIRGGSSDLQKEGMPFHVRSIAANLKDEIEKSPLQKHEREVLAFYLYRKLDDMMLQPSLFDFAEVLGLLKKETIPTETYPELGLFYDGNLPEFTNRNAMQSRLSDNADFFERVQHIHEYDNLNQQLEKLFDEGGVKKLKSEEWQTVDYKDVKESNEKLKKQKGKALEYKENVKKLTSEKLGYWEKAQNENTKPGQRKRHIIVFNPDKEESVNMTFEFDERLKKEDVDQKSTPYAEAKGKKLQVHLPNTGEGSKFYKIVYKHNKETKSSFEFHICVLTCSPIWLKSIQTYYSVDVKNKSLTIKNDGQNIVFGDKSIDPEEIVIEEPSEIVKLNANQAVEISSESPAWEDESLRFQLQIEEIIVPILLKEQIVKTPPVLGPRIWKLKRENEAHVLFANNKLQQGTREFNVRDEFKQYLQYEEQWIRENIHYAELSIHGLEKISLEVNSSIAEAYQNLLDYFSSRKLLPSLAYMDNVLEELSRQFIQAYNHEIESIEEDAHINAHQRNLFKLGTIRNGKKILLTPLHPLNIAYQLAVRNEIGKEGLEAHMLDRLRPLNLLPYMYGEQNQLYKPVYQRNASEWTVYEPLHQETLEGTNTYHASVVEEKMKQFVDHFKYLFISGSKSPLKVNIINMANDREVMRGVFHFLKSQVEKEGFGNVVPIEIALYQREVAESAFELFSNLENPERIEEAFDISLQSKSLDPTDMLRIVRENIQYYKLEDEGHYNYAHISFFKMSSQEQDAKNIMDEIDTGIALNGLLSSTSSLTTSDDYRVGFGTKHTPSEENEIMRTTKNMNELASNLDNEGRNPYRKGQTIVTMSSSVQDDVLDNLYDCSHWVTFVDPNVDLDFFQRSSKELLVIHYSDQYSSSDKYDAITVTDKNVQYGNVIKQYLQDKDIHPETSDIHAAIRAFNTINGEWLLRIIGSKGHFSREKLSIVSAIKYTLSFYQHKDITWVPISLEEILRVAGAVKLTKSEGVFSASNLGVRGATSDDILLVGVETKDDDIFVHFYPVEVKIGGDQTSKAREQIEKTKRLFDEQLKEVDEEGNRPFRNKFFRNFFVQMLLANARKFMTNGIWDTGQYEKLEALKGHLMNDDFHVGYHLEEFIGKGAILSFRSEGTWRSALIEQDVMNLILTETDAYTGIVEDLSVIREKMEQGHLDIPVSKLLSTTYNQEAVEVRMPELVTVGGDAEGVPEREVDTSPGYTADSGNSQVADGGAGYPGNSSGDNSADHDRDTDQDESTTEVTEVATDVQPLDYSTDVGPSTPSLEDVRVRLGEVQGSTKTLYWEYGHPELANRHILISGKSGQGKTYFIQSMLMELADQGISSIIFDYTDGFKKGQLEPQFKERLGDNLINYLVARDGFPINPFKRNEKEIDEDEFIQEDYSDVAERIKSVFSAIYRDLGHQQLNAIYQATIRGLRKYEEQMNLNVLARELEEDGSGPAKTALAQISLLIDKNPFDHTQENDWSKLGDQKGKVHIIQMTTYTRDVQLMITEFILWDIWHYKVQHGDKSLPFPVILDEAQNLDHSDKSPSSKILTEGRKFGWSGWYATQFLKGQLTSDEISRLQNTSQKIFFQPPENEISSIASMLGHDTHSRKDWEKRLASLRKGQCIAFGPSRGANGELLNSNPVIIDITSMDERFKF
ncbi:DNA phosphorothioation-dependent restriction protein DptH [Pontibacillus halophilus JSM 076056 = DSM 19796]|uniref:DNA phosphorothioation-dependent restriction protein DptH n=1 Tax=Pontibacillus halophilus JSM 076056 = DSM 19796 TaxID=1385510 RepID=A0A0A5G9K2_9BACI|nr:DNA phosphorothioation-dependent restriction protein DptH [Pontibacillus halophilus]KGX89831.1 DNA phosphorothioation-dependent restriction protein DptH [Pontibacillus halophilus JSM 076056 = DSM 19796]